jgi:hypothetical protein
MLEKKSREQVPTDVASTAVNNNSTMSNNGGSAIDEAALADIMKKLADLQKDLQMNHDGVKRNLSSI